MPKVRILLIIQLFLASTDSESQRSSTNDPKNHVQRNFRELAHNTAMIASTTPNTPPTDPAFTTAPPVAIAVLLAVAVPAVNVPLGPLPDPVPVPVPAEGSTVVSVGRPTAPLPPLAVATDVPDAPGASEAPDAAASTLLKAERAGLPKSAVPVAEAADPVADETPEAVDEDTALLEELLLY